MKKLFLLILVSLFMVFAGPAMAQEKYNQIKKIRGI